MQNHKLTLYMCHKLSNKFQMFEYRRQGEFQIVDVSKLFETISLEINLKVKILSIR